MKIITRPFVCLKDHSKLTTMAVVGTQSQVVYIKKIKYEEISHITPHLVSFNEEHLKTHKNIEILYTCACVGCGVELTKDNKLNFLEIKKGIIPVKQMKALIDFTDTGYELD